MIGSHKTGYHRANLPPVAEKPARSSTPITLIAIAGDWTCSADVRESHGAADVIRLHGFELETEDALLKFDSLEDIWGHGDRDEIREALTEAAAEAYYEQTEPGDSLEVRRGDYLRDQQKDAERE